MMLFRNIKTGGLIVASAKFKGENWVAVDQSPETASEDPVLDLPEDVVEEEQEKPNRGRKKK
jgi:hypothetical protein